MLRHHQKIESRSVVLALLILVVASVGGAVEILPLFRIETTVAPVPGMRPYTPLELAGRNVYVREGCYACHSQMIRTLKADVLRYGPYSRAAESQYDHPFQWGSKRTGPDLARVGGKYSDAWHVAHLKVPREVVLGSIMPGYPFLAETEVKVEGFGRHLATLRQVGVPYTDDQIANAEADLVAQASADGEGPLKERYGPKVASRDFDGDPKRLTEMDALVAYLQMLGTLAELPNDLPDAPQTAEAAK